MAAISVVTPVVLTSCGLSSSETNKTQISWDTTKTQDGLIFDSTNNSAVIILKSDGEFASTGISKKLTFDNIKSSLDTSSKGTSLYSVLSGSIKDINNYNVKLSINTNPVVFDYSKGSIGNYFQRQFQLIHKLGTNVSAVNLNFRVNNFNDSYNATTGQDLKWDVDAIKNALKEKTDDEQQNNTRNKLHEINQKDNGIL